jgi:hypothetical protein
MNKEKEALIHQILAQPDVPRKVAPKNLLHFVDRMKPTTQQMRDYLIAVFGAETQTESCEIQKKWYEKMTQIEQKSFSEDYYRCCMNGLNRVPPSKTTIGVFAPSV